MQKYGFIFDCDGTLIDSIGLAMESMHYAIAQIGEAPRRDDEIKTFFGTGADRILSNVLGDREKGLRAFEHYVEHQAELAPKMKVHAGIRELLDNLSAAKVPMALVTGRHARDMEVVLRPHDLSKYFVTLIADSHLKESKPSPEGILLAAQRLGVEPQNSVYIGDSPTDVVAAHRAGGISVAAMWDSVEHIELLKFENPQFQAKLPSDVWKVYQQLRGS